MLTLWKSDLLKENSFKLVPPYKYIFKISCFQENFPTSSTFAKSVGNISFISSISRLEKPYANFFEADVANPLNHLTC